MGYCKVREGPILSFSNVGALFKSGHVTGPSGRPRNEGFISRDRGGAEVPQVNAHEGVGPLRKGNRK